VIISFVSCQTKEKEKAMLVFDDIQQFPQEIIITQFSENFVNQTDTFKIGNKKEARIPIGTDRPKYVYVQKEGQTLQFFLKPESKLTVSKNNGHYIFKGDVKQENAFLEEIRSNQELRKKAWDYSVPFAEFKQQVADYFEYKAQLLDKYLPEKKDGLFLRLNAIDDQALSNSAILDFINSIKPKSKRDSLFFEYIDQDLLNFKKMEAYLDAGRLRSFYGKKAVEYFMRKKYGKELDSIRKQKEYYILRDDIISEYFHQPLKSILLYTDLRYYQEEYDYAPDSLQLTPLRKMLARYKDGLDQDAYNSLKQAMDKYEAKKQAYAKGNAIPTFILKDEAGKDYKLKPKDFGKLVLIDVWASWCGPCIRSFPKVKELEKRYPEQLKAISISIDKNFDQFKKGLDDHKVSGQLKLYSENAFTGDFAKFFQITGIPRYILLNQEGKIVDANLNFADVENIIKKEL
jgi:thiol-disulfide isomerase/thioredoxin